MNLIRKIGFSKKTEDDVFAQKIRSITGFKPKDISLYKTAFTHKSLHKKDKDGRLISYERLEFLGDALLDSAITDYLYHNLPSSEEGDLTKMRSKIVSRKHLNEIGKDMDLVSLSKKDESKRKYSYNAHGDLFESLVAAIYLDRGYNVMNKFINNKMITEYVDLKKLQGKITSYKSLFIEWSQKHKKDFYFDTYEDSGNSKKLYFSVKVLINKKVVGKGRATSKKKAEEIACKRAYYKFQDSMKLEHS